MRRTVQGLAFRDFFYDPLDYAWSPHEQYLSRYAGGQKRVLFLGLNPGQFGMVQTGVPFGEIDAVRRWLGINARVRLPASPHPKRPVIGFACARSETSGRRLWGLFESRYGMPADFFAEHTVLNYCPLAFLDHGGRNKTPDRLPQPERTTLYAACDEHLQRVVNALEPEWLIGIGVVAHARAKRLYPGGEVKLGKITHPACRGMSDKTWAPHAAAQLRELGVWN